MSLIYCCTTAGIAWLPQQHKCWNKFVFPIMRLVIFIIHRGLENIETFSSRPRPWPRPRLFLQDQDQDQDQDQICSCPRGASRPRPRFRDYIPGWEPNHSPSKRRGQSCPHFSAHVYCGQTAGWIRIPLGMAVGLGPGDVVLDGDPFQKNGALQPLIFGQCLLWPNGWMDHNATWYGGRPWPRRHCVRWEPSHPRPKGGHSSPCLLWPNGRPSLQLLSTCLHCSRQSVVAHFRACPFP